MTNQTQKSGNGFPFTKYFEHNACPECDHGTIEFMVNGEVVETADCPTCYGQGFLEPSKRAEIMDGHRALQAAIADSKTPRYEPRN